VVHAPGALRAMWPLIIPPCPPVSPCRQQEVVHAPGALRAMWPLIFSKDEGVRAAVVDSWYNLYLLGDDSGRRLSTRDQVGRGAG